MPGESDGGELDQLIGDMVAEAARRRAAPDWPADEEARIVHELRRRAPRDEQSPPLEELVGRVQRDASTLAGPGQPSPDEVRTARTRAGRRRSPAEFPAGLRSFALAVAAAISEMAGRLGALEARSGASGAARPLRTGTTGAGRDDTATTGSAARATWAGRLPGLLGTVEGRVLYADADADAVVTDLRRQGIDAYGVAADDDGVGDTADVRRGDLLEHLGGLPDGALGAAVLVGPPERVTGPTFPALLAALCRAATTVVVASESPWAWRARLGRAAELAERWPVTSDTWAGAFAEAGLSPVVELDAEGRSYLVVARRAR